MDNILPVARHANGDRPSHLGADRVHVVIDCTLGLCHPLLCSGEEVFLPGPLPTCLPYCVFHKHELLIFCMHVRLLVAHPKLVLHNECVLLYMEHGFGVSGEFCVCAWLHMATACTHTGRNTEPQSLNPTEIPNHRNSRK